MKISIFGSGYVGLVTGACLSAVGHDVVCVDVDAAKVARLKAADVPVHEPGLEQLIRKGLEVGTLRFTTDADLAVAHAETQMIAVGTPPDETGAADLQHVLAVARIIAERMDGRKVVVTKSTVPVGTSDRVHEAMVAVLRDRGRALAVETASNPEFLKEGAAVADFQRPDRIVVGTASDYAKEVLRELYAPFNRNHDRIIFMDARSAELTKYAANAMLATKISFINEMANLAERLGADIENVRRGIGSDPRIGFDFIYAGLGYGGSCFPKDLRALGRMARDVGYDAPLVAAVQAVNDHQRESMFERIAEHFGGAVELAGRTVAVWGLAFKPNTDDMREAPARTLIESLWAAGATVRAYDPAAMTEAARIFGARADLTLCANPYAALDGADALAICTEWSQFRAPDFDEMARRLNARTIFDGRNMYSPSRMVEAGWTYVSVGRPTSRPTPTAVETFG